MVYTPERVVLCIYLNKRKINLHWQELFFDTFIQIEKKNQDKSIMHYTLNITLFRDNDAFSSSMKD